MVSLRVLLFCTVIIYVTLQADASPVCRRKLKKPEDSDPEPLIRLDDDNNAQIIHNPQHHHPARDEDQLVSENVNEPRPGIKEYLSRKRQRYFDALNNVRMGNPYEELRNDEHDDSEAASGEIADIPIETGLSHDERHPGHSKCRLRFGTDATNLQDKVNRHLDDGAGQRHILDEPIKSEPEYHIIPKPKNYKSISEPTDWEYYAPRAENEGAGVHSRAIPEESFELGSEHIHPEPNDDDSIRKPNNREYYGYRVENGESAE